jgi:hypothetical protein
MSERTQCRACGLTFTRTSSFDQHRVGPQVPINQPMQRRCLSADELRAKGWAPNVRGDWRKPAPAGTFSRVA